MSDKTSLRRSLFNARKSMAPELRGRWDAAIGGNIMAWWHRHRVASLGIFWPMLGEPDLRAVYDDLAMQGVELALPIVVSKDAALSFAVWNPGDTLTRDAMGVMVPATTARRVQPEALLIPCLGFNAERIRLGYGGGFYDRTLAVLPRPLAIGIAYSSALVVFDKEVHDVALDLIITEAPDTC